MQPSLRPLSAAALLFAGLLAPAAAHAQVPMTGLFVAEARCPALQSIRAESNPGNVAVEPGKSYALLGRNAEDGSHYLIRLPGVTPERRWVAFGCGRIEEGGSGASSSASAAPPPSARPAEAPTRGERRGPPATGLVGDVVLAASWPHAFCEGKPRARECRAGGGPARLTLHGLWPEGEYCGVADTEGERWDDLPEPPLSAATRRALAAQMPGLSSNLHRHEWAKHGTCSGLSADAYYAESARLVAALNDSAVGELFAQSVGYALDVTEVRDAFDRAFGRGAGRTVMLDCARDGDRTLLGEIRVNLRYSAEAPLGAPLARLLADAPSAPRGCRGGAVDAPGLQ